MTIFDTSYAQKCKYHYSDVKCIGLNLSHPELKPGKIVGLINNGTHSEPEILAIIFDNSNILGYVSIGLIIQERIASMVSDWLQRDWFCAAQISKVEDHRVYLDIIMGDFPSDDL